MKLKSIIRKIREEMYNKQFKITFRTLDGNKETIFVDARTESAAIRIVEREYEVDEIIKIEEVEE